MSLLEVYQNLNPFLSDDEDLLLGDDLHFAPSWDAQINSYTRLGWPPTSTLPNLMTGSLSNSGSASTMSSSSVASASPFGVSSNAYPNTPLISTHLTNLMQETRDSVWCMTNQHEPTNENGRSIYLNFVTLENEIYACMICEKTHDQQDRATAHIRKHFNHRPFRCNGTCGVDNCPEKYCCPTDLKCHIRRPKVECNICNRAVFKKDLPKHLINCELRAIASSGISFAVNRDGKRNVSVSSTSSLMPMPLNMPSVSSTGANIAGKTPALRRSPSLSSLASLSSTSSASSSMSFIQPSGAASSVSHSPFEEVWNAPWRAANTAEPTDNDGRSIYLKFLTKTNGSHLCGLCSKNIPRQDRAISHVRMHFDHRPFGCDGRCGTVACQDRFFSSYYLQVHIKSRKKEQYQQCNSTTLPHPPHMGDCDVRGRSMASLVGIVPPNQLPDCEDLNLLDDAEIHYSMENDPYSDLPIDEGNHAQVLSEVTHDALLVPPSANFQVSPMNYTKNGKCMPPPLTNSLVGSLGDLAFGSMSMSLSVSSALSSSEMSSPMISSSMPFSVSSDRSSRLIHLKEVVQEVRDSIWCRTDNLEPTDSKGRSIYLDFVMQDGGIYTCMFCQKKIDRQDRATGHIRKHFNHRPFRCDGACGFESCPEKFWCQSYLNSHINRPKGECKICGQKLFKSDLRQHRSHCSSGLVLLSRDDD